MKRQDYIYNSLFRKSFLMKEIFSILQPIMNEKILIFH